MKTKYPNFMAISLGIIVAEMLALVLIPVLSHNA